MSRLVKIINNKYIQIEEYRNPNICFNTSEYNDFEDYCTLRETFDPFEIFYENQELKEKLDKYENPEDMTLFAMWCTEKVKDENEKLNKKYENAVADYETTMFEKEQLNSLVNSCQEEIRRLKKQLEVGEEQYNDLVEEKEKLQEQLSVKSLQLEEIKLSKRDYTQENILEMKLILKENQQKEFIEYMNKTIEELECDDVDDEEMKGYLIQRIDTFKEILQKYKSIIGVSNENSKD